MRQQGLPCQVAQQVEKSEKMPSKHVLAVCRHWGNCSREVLHREKEADEEEEEESERERERERERARGRETDRERERASERENRSANGSATLQTSP